VASAIPSALLDTGCVSAVHALGHGQHCGLKLGNSATSIVVFYFKETFIVLSTGTCSGVGLIIYGNEVELFLDVHLLTNCKKTHTSLRNVISSETT
jgi:hypothetical protein